ncbi:pathogenesis-related protein PRMS-like [Phragmites australis]|uniref:pathogenesis-related protein PRMS-like n=1 Tax=Phragmites australis TaxID=29695 RepID=UPI002D768B0E|nr:pathogenesis-related protein PRMS-like [Phragmites australis]
MSPFSYLAIFSLALTSATAAAAPGDSAPAAGPPKVVSTRQQFLQAHNEARAAAGVPPLAWNATLQLDAMRYAKELRTRCNAHPLVAWGTDGVYGLNLFKGTGRQPTAEAVESWVGEGHWYDRGTGACAAPDGRNCGGYTQVVWRATTQLGCSRRVCRNSVDTVAVCEYYPPGNVKSKRPY